VSWVYAVVGLRGRVPLRSWCCAGDAGAGGDSG